MTTVTYGRTTEWVTSREGATVGYIVYLTKTVNEDGNKVSTSNIAHVFGDTADEAERNAETLAGLLNNKVAVSNN